MRFLSGVERDLLLASITDRPFKEYCFALLETGCRPMEVARVTAANVTADGKTWILDEHKTDHTGNARIVYLTPAMQELTRRLMREYPTGPLFRGTREVGGIRIPWTANAIRCRFRYLRKRHPELAGVTAYTLRHHFATQALLNGVPGPLVSSLLGHKSLKMLDIYSHVGQAASDLHQAAIRATARA
jgi:integrase